MKHLKSAAPVLASLDMDRTMELYTGKLGFKKGWHDANYGIVSRDEIVIHFWKTDNEIFPQNTSCYVYVTGVDELHKEMEEAGVVHPNGTLEDKPWGMREFAILDTDGNMIKFGENL
jgi:hypothetical protein